MDKVITDYINGLVNTCITSLAFYKLSEKEKEEQKLKIEEHLYKVIIALLIDNLEMEQLFELEDADPKDPEAQELIAEFAADIPGFEEKIQKRLTQEVDTIIRTGQIPSFEPAA